MLTVRELKERFPNYNNILEAALKAEDHLSDGHRVLVELSGTVNSEILVHLLENLDPEPWQLHYVAFGIPESNTRLNLLQQRHNITILHTNLSLRKMARLLDATLYINEIRQADKRHYSTCYTHAGRWIPKFRPLFYLTDLDRAVYLKWIEREYATV